MGAGEGEENQKEERFLSANIWKRWRGLRNGEEMESVNGTKRRTGDLRGSAAGKKKIRWRNRESLERRLASRRKTCDQVWTGCVCMRACAPGWLAFT